MFKKIFSLLAIALFALSAYGQDSAPAKVTIQFDKETHEYGEIEFASDGTCKFQFTNTGTEPLVLTNVRASCGCTTPEWTKDPVKPGEKGEIVVKYNTHSAGSFSKSITVHSNGQPSPIILRIKGVVKPMSTGSIK